MHQYIISTGTVTYAIKGRDLLRRNGFKAEAHRATSTERIGCGYGIVVSGNITTAKSLLENAGIKILDVKQKN